MQILEVRHLQLVSAVAEEGNLTRAGTRLHLTQSALSHQLLDLEERLGTQLFHRVSRKMTLTEAGERVLESARKVLDELAHTEDDLRLFAANRRGAVRLTTECYTVYHWLPNVMKHFEESFPGVEIRIDVNATERPFEALLEGSIDVAFVTTERAPRGVELQDLFSDEMLVIVGPDHRFAKQEYVKTTELAEETMLTYSTLKGNYVYERLMRPAGLEPKRHIQVQLTEAMIELAKANIGVTVLAQWAVGPFLESGAVIGVPLTRRGFSRNWKAAHAAARPLPVYVKAFTKMVASYQPGRTLEPIAVAQGSLRARAR
ncbi:MAG TPA: LysR family transcriptional regulator [Thermoanaerobaculia bacterium]|nr:LysR family transcriptional regulator [Thermoanaerobaculia bacterium]